MTTKEICDLVADALDRCQCSDTYNEMISDVLTAIKGPPMESVPTVDGEKK